MRIPAVCPDTGCACYSLQSMIGILSLFGAICDIMNAAERRDLVEYLISEVELFPREEQKTQKRGQRRRGERKCVRC